jgi:hypothetical protein
MTMLWAFPAPTRIQAEFERIEEMSQSIDPEALWTRPDAERLDATTYEVWLRETSDDADVPGLDVGSARQRHGVRVQVSSSCFSSSRRCAPATGSCTCCSPRAARNRAASLARCNQSPPSHQRPWPGDPVPDAGSAHPMECQRSERPRRRHKRCCQARYRRAAAVACRRHRV